MTKIEPYHACCIQTSETVAKDRREIKERVLPRTLELIDSAPYSFFTYAMDWAPTFEGPIPTKLLAFPEAALHGFLYQYYPACLTDVRKWRGERGIQEASLKVAIEIPGEETDILGERAKANDLYIVMGAFEYDSEWPGRHFNTAFIINPQGKVILKYRKVNPCASFESTTSPHDILDEYMERYGKGKTIIETLFPVVDTEIGRMGCYICQDRFFPEVTRALVFNGAEVLIHPTVWPAGEFAYQDTWTSLNQARAIEGMVYIIAPVMGQLLCNAPSASGLFGHSMIVNHYGKILAEAGRYGEEIINAPIDIEKLRSARRVPLVWNQLALLRTEAYLDLYKTCLYPPNLFREKAPDSLPEIMEHIRAAVEKLYKKKIYV